MTTCLHHEKNTQDRTTTFLRQGASAGAVGSMRTEWNDERETERSVMESNAMKERPPFAAMGGGCPRVSWKKGT